MVNYNDPTLREDIKKAMEKAGIRNEDEVFMEEIRKKYGFDKQDNQPNFIDNLSNYYDKIKNEYFIDRNYQNRYKKGCIPSNIIYNTVSNYQISPNQKLVEKGNLLSNIIMKKAISTIPVAGPYINGIVLGDKIGNGVTNLYNALEEAECFD